MSLNNLVKRLQDIMRNDAGINGDAQRIEQMVWILFLKVYDAKEEIWEFYDENYTSIIPEELRWRNWAVDHKDGKALTGDALLDFVNGKLFPTLKAIEIDENTPMSQIIVRTAFEDNNNYMKDGILLRQVINVIDEIDFEEYEDRHAFGEIYETILRSLQSAGNSGEFYTPRAVTDFMVQMIKPKLGESIADFACGTGGFLLAAFEHMKPQSREIEKQNFLKNRAFFGADNTPLVVTLASMNLYLHDIGTAKSPIVCQDSLIDKSDKMFNVILANPPFGTRPQGSVEVYANRPEFVKTSDNQVNFLQHIMSIVKDKGRVGVVLPDNVLTDGGATAKVREKLLKDFNLHTILRLPTGIFYANGVKTNVLFFDKGNPTKDIWVYDYRTGIKHTLATKPMTRENLDDFVASYCSGHIQDRVQTYSEENPNGRWRKFTEEEVYSRDQLKLDFKWLDLGAKDDRTITEILNDMQSKSAAITDAVTKLQEILGGIDL